MQSAPQVQSTQQNMTMMSIAPTLACVQRCVATAQVDPAHERNKAYIAELLGHLGAASAIVSNIQRLTSSVKLPPVPMPASAPVNSQTVLADSAKQAGGGGNAGGGLVYLTGGDLTAYNNYQRAKAAYLATKHSDK